MERVFLAPDPAKKELIRRIERESGTEVSLCYQCGKCAAGCPVAFAMDYSPRQILRLLQLELVDDALKAESIWICATCETCTARCPRGLDIASLMDAMRREALARGVVTDKKVAAFNQAFLNLVEKYGRVHEVELTLQFNMKTGQFFKDMALGLPMFTRGKVHFLPSAVKGRQEVKNIFEKVRQMGGEQR